MKKNRNLVIYLFIVNILFIITLIPFYLTVVNNSNGKICTLSHGDTVDYYLYISSIREGKDGAWAISGLFTSEPTNKSILYIFFIILGKISRITNISPIAMYHVARVFSFELFAIGIYFLVGIFVSSRWILFASLLGLMSTALPVRIFGQDHHDFNYWWPKFLDPMLRFSGLPHHLFGTALMIWTIYSVFKLLKRNSKRLLIFCCMSAFLSALIFPPAGAVVIFCFPIMLLVNQMIQATNKKTFNWSHVLIVSLVCFFSLLGIVIVKMQTNLGFPWSQWNTWDMDMWNNNAPNFLAEYWLGTIPLLILSLPSIVYIFYKRLDYKYFFLNIWALIPYAVLPFTNIIGIGKIRVIFMASYIPLGILSFLTLRKLASLWRGEKHHEKILAVIVSTIIFIFSVISYNSNKEEIIGQKVIRAPLNVCIPKDQMSSIDFIRDSVQPYSIVLSDFSIGNLLPAFARIKTYYGHWTQTKDYNQKGSKVARFFTGSMDSEEASHFIKEGGIDYIYYGKAEKSYGGDILNYGINLEEIYDKDNIKIYQII